MKKTPEKKSSASKTKQKVTKAKAATPKVAVSVVKAAASKAKAVKSAEPASGEKQSVIEKFAQRKGDTGSPEVQIALLTHKIMKLSGHLGENKKDNHSRRGLLKVVAKRRRILNYLQKIDEKRYKKLIGELSLKK